MSRTISVSDRSWVLPRASGPICRASAAKTTTTIDALGRPHTSEIVKKKQERGGRKMREVFTTHGYALLDDEVKLSTPGGLVSLAKLWQGLLSGERYFVESFQVKLAAHKLEKQEILSSPGAIEIDVKKVAEIIATLEAAFVSKRETMIPRLCFSCVGSILSRLQKNCQTPLRCEVDNKLYPSEVLVTANGQHDAEVLSVTDVLESSVTSVELAQPFKAIVIDGLICA